MGKPTRRRSATSSHYVGLVGNPRPVEIYTVENWNEYYPDRANLIAACRFGAEHNLWESLPPLLMSTGGLLYNQPGNTQVLELIDSCVDHLRGPGPG